MNRRITHQMDGPYVY